MKKLLSILFSIAFAFCLSAADVDLGNLNDITWNLVGTEYVAVFNNIVDDYSRLWWEFSNTNNPTDDSSFVGTNTGWLVSSPVWADSSNGISACYYFDGTTDYIWKTNGLGDFTDLTNGTVLIWVRPNTTASGIDRFFSISRYSTGPGSANNSAIAMNFNYSAPTKMTVFCNVDGAQKWVWDATAYQGAAAEGWRLYALVHDGVEAKIYKTGIDITSAGSFVTAVDKTVFFKDVFTTASSKADHISVGATLYSNIFYHGFTGWADEPKIFNIVMSTSEISTIFWNLATNYGWTAWDVVNRSTFSNASCVVNCIYPGEGNKVPSQGLRYYSSGDWIIRGVGADALNGAIWVLKDDHGAYYFDGANDYLQFYSSPFLGGVSNFTITCSFFLWSNPTVDNYDALWGKVYNNSYTEGLYHCNEARGGITNHMVIVNNSASIVAYTTNGLLVTGVWHDVAVVFDGLQAAVTNRIAYYHNGIQQSLYFESVENVTKTHTGAANLLVGNDATSNARYPPIYIRRFSVWSGDGAQYSLSSNIIYSLWAAWQ